MGKNIPKLLYASSDNADMRYLSGMYIPDRAILLERAGKRTLLVSDLEYARAREQCRGCEVLSLSEYRKKLKEKKREPTSANVIQLLLRERKVKNVTVPRDFPAYLYERLRRKRGLKVSVADNTLLPEREVKSREEIKAIERVQRINEKALRLALVMIRVAKVKRHRLYLDGKPLTSERIKQVLLRFYIDNGCDCPQGMIVSCGKHTALPHHHGTGQLYANNPIILDLFPRDRESGYWADMTRTVVRGKADRKLKRMYEAVREAQNAAFLEVKEGAKGSEVHGRVLEIYKAHGFETAVKGGVPQGMIHNTGHGLGLEIHEEPRLGPAYRGESALKSGNVVTVEPGLYYLKTGGVRIEDLVVVQKNGCRNLTKAEKFLEIA